ncbi:MAG TPA: hypothetical protein VF355_09265 [Anaerolineaceae bacterium]|jgi:hypothetical protein
MNAKIMQAYKQAPWRVQLQHLFYIVLAIVMILVVAALYLNISAQAATAGLDFQGYEWQRQDLERQIANNIAILGQITSEENMVARAKALGYTPIAMDKAVYVVVPGYTGRQPAIFAPAPSSDMLADPIIKPSYTQSLWEWLFQGVLIWTNGAGGTAQ